MPRPSSSPALKSRDNPLVRHLQKVALRRQPGLVLLEGPFVVQEAVGAGVELELLAVREGAQPEVPARRVVALSEALIRSLSQTETPQGVLAVAPARFAEIEEARERARAARTPLVVLDGIQDPGNVGAIVRTAAAFGFPAAVVLPGTADPYGPKAIRASAGTVFRLAVAEADWSRLAGLRGLGASAAARRRLDEVDLAAAELLVFGSEAHGLSRRDLEEVAIPMVAGIDSLNVAAAAAVLLFETRRRLDAGRGRRP